MRGHREPGSGDNAPQEQMVRRPGLTHLTRKRNGCGAAIARVTMARLVASWLALAASPDQIMGPNELRSPTPSRSLEPLALSSTASGAPGVRWQDGMRTEMGLAACEIATHSPERCRELLYAWQVAVASKNLSRPNSTGQASAVTALSSAMPTPPPPQQQQQQQQQGGQHGQPAPDWQEDNDGRPGRQRQRTQGDSLPLIPSPSPTPPPLPPHIPLPPSLPFRSPGSPPPPPDVAAQQQAAGGECSDVCPPGCTSGPFVNKEKPECDDCLKCHARGVSGQQQQQQRRRRRPPEAAPAHEGQSVADWLRSGFGLNKYRVVRYPPPPAPAPPPPSPPPSPVPSPPPPSPPSEEALQKQREAAAKEQQAWEKKNADEEQEREEEEREAYEKEAADRAKAERKAAQQQAKEKKAEEKATKRAERQQAKERKVEEKAAKNAERDAEKEARAAAKEARANRANQEGDEDYLDERIAWLLIVLAILLCCCCCCCLWRCTRDNVVAAPPAPVANTPRRYERMPASTCSKKTTTTTIFSFGGSKPAVGRSRVPMAAQGKGRASKDHEYFEGGYVHDDPLSSKEAVLQPGGVPRSALSGGGAPSRTPPPRPGAMGATTAPVSAYDYYSYTGGSREARQ